MLAVAPASAVVDGSATCAALAGSWRGAALSCWLVIASGALLTHWSGVAQLLACISRPFVDLARNARHFLQTSLSASTDPAARFIPDRRELPPDVAMQLNEQMIMYPFVLGALRGSSRASPAL